MKFYITERINSKLQSSESIGQAAVVSSDPAGTASKGHDDDGIGAGSSIANSDNGNDTEGLLLAVYSVFNKLIIV
jgi:hypothetical protein